ncbi:Myb-like DNA-binding domain containing protein [Trichomonas vaginalis G3]|uniref:Myb-like DNA-binding domain containing protein n=1 Tax=Trichomonas vaginalis (strain ATCC PRA-98 / G3) TaxID=412133 RepID=A2DC56_TRIV3|nr:RNA polymerase II transcription regulator recruiting protein [Trichomonas vaginalis G3]EAY22097.1 Myb-like DNA-binding domain containing protein [Trichomonas vaginalis G3]KAI5525260.1 RNA polymerase II transcription regulator recruiting protein [Trichomonas vaginalis G3]|eukprot:XP_001583083.1 Myb-like DNA-binding domain containing protein [Trichomonas vaginalis G3]
MVTNRGSRLECHTLNVPGRNGRQCRERWLSVLAPDLCKDEWDEEEDKILLDMQKKIGNHWSLISTYLSGRTPIMVKNRFRLLIRRERKREKKAKKTARSTINLDHNECIFDTSLNFENVDFIQITDDFDPLITYNQINDDLFDNFAASDDI